MIIRLFVLLGWLLVSTACTNTAALVDFANALNAAHVSNCLQVQGSVPPYGTAILYAKAGELDCMRIWEERLRLGP